MAAKNDDEAKKQRIISHMNRDHSDSVMRYAEHYAKVPYTKASNAKLVDISLDKITLSCQGRKHDVALQPPLSSFAEARERFVKMDKDCIAAMGRHPVSILHYRGPNKPIHWFVLFMSAFAFFTLPRKRNFMPGGAVHEYAFKYIPGLSNLVLLTRWPTFAFLVVAHTLEAMNMAKRLKRHSVPYMSKTWFLWITATLTEGFSSFMRFNDVVADTEKVNASKKH